MDLAFESGQTGEALIRRYASDDLVASLLVLHDLHPDDLETRVRHILAKLPGHPELMGVFDGVVRVRVAGEGKAVCGKGVAGSGTGCSRVSD